MSAPDYEAALRRAVLLLEDFERGLPHEARALDSILEMLKGRVSKDPPELAALSDHVQFRLLFNAGRLRFLDHRDVHPFGRLIRSIRRHEYRYGFNPLAFINQAYSVERAEFDLALFRLVLRSEIPWKLGRRPPMSYDWTAAFHDGEEIEMALRREIDEVPRPGQRKRVELPISVSEARSMLDEADLWASESNRLLLHLINVRKALAKTGIVFNLPQAMDNLLGLMQLVKARTWGKASLDGFEPADNKERWLRLSAILATASCSGVRCRQMRTTAKATIHRDFRESDGAGLLAGTHSGLRQSLRDLGRSR